MSNHWIWDYKAKTYIIKYLKPRPNKHTANYHLNKISNSQFFELLDFIKTINNNTLQIKIFCFGRQLKALSL